MESLSESRLRFPDDFEACFRTVVHSSDYLGTLERGCPCWLLKMRQRRIQGAIQYESGLSLVFLLGLSYRYRRFCPALAALVGTVQNIFFPHRLRNKNRIREFFWTSTVCCGSFLGFSSIFILSLCSLVSNLFGILDPWITYERDNSAKSSFFFALPYPSSPTRQPILRILYSVLDPDPHRHQIKIRIRIRII